MVCTLCIVPPLARLGGRVPLPIYGTVLQPRNIGFCLLNRHYVKPQLKTLAIKVAQQLQQQYPGTVLLSTGAHDVLQVQDGEIERLIPFVAHYVTAVDMAARCITAEWEADW